MEGKWKAQVARCKVVRYVECGMWKVLVEGAGGRVEGRVEGGSGGQTQGGDAQRSQPPSPSSPPSHPTPSAVQYSIKMYTAT